jgi:hypothetical protein
MVKHEITTDARAWENGMPQQRAPTLRRVNPRNLTSFHEHEMMSLGAFARQTNASLLRVQFSEEPPVFDRGTAHAGYFGGGFQSARNIGPSGFRMAFAGQCY